MGSPKDKTDYLNETKARIRDGINRLGGSLTPSNTFRSYANELLNIFSAMPKVTGQGYNITLNNTKSNGVMSILVQGNEDGNKVVTGQNQVVVQKDFLINDEIEQGNYSSTYGTPQEATNRVRTKEFNNVTGNTEYEIICNKQFIAFFYDANENYIDASGSWHTANNYPFTTPVGTAKIKFGFRNSDNSVIIPSDISDLILTTQSAIQTYPLSLGDIELYEGDEIQGNFIYRDGGEVEEITNATLLAQLANLDKAKSYEDQTNVVITSDSNNAQMTAQVIALRKLV